MTRLIFVGGFLGSGKTTLLYEVTRMLTARGLTVGLITNDQAPDLADTAILEQIDVKVAEVAGSCFCCDFKGLRRAIESLGGEPDIILAEPVGSCTDLSATLINPIKDIMKTEISVSPLTVLIDPSRLKDILAGGTAGLHPSAAYIMRKQLEEGDIIAISKSDIFDPEDVADLSGKLGKQFPDRRILAISAITGDGIEAWLESALNGKEVGKHILEIDYDKYAEGEAVLGWLNCSAYLSGNEIDWDSFARRLMELMAAEFDSRNIAVGHVKLILENGDNYISSNLTGRSGTLTCRWSAGKGNSADLIVNARVEMAPEDLQNLFLLSLDKAAGKEISKRINRIRSISPGYPKPTYRYS